MNRIINITEKEIESATWITFKIMQKFLIVSLRATCPKLKCRQILIRIIKNTMQKESALHGQLRSVMLEHVEKLAS